MKDITPIFETIFTLISLVVTIFVIPYFRAKTNEKQQAEINGWVKIAVDAAEQIYAGHGHGKEKKEYVISFLEDHGITLDAEKVEALIEAAVYQLKNGVFLLGSEEG